MSKQWKFFFIIETLLIIWVFYQLTTNLFVALVAISGVLVLVKSSQSNKVNKIPSYLIGFFLLSFAILSTSAFWVVMLFTVVFMSIKGKGTLNNMNTKVFNKAPWNEKEMIMVETAEQTPKNGKRKKQTWLGSQKIGSSIFEWDDINMSILMGDTIVDLGNTFLPKSNSYIVIRKGFGKTRILVPKGIGIMIEHSALKGKMIFEAEEYGLINESVKMYSKDYDSQNRKLKIITSVFVGDLEVIAI